MDLSAFPAKFKRIRQWTEFISCNQLVAQKQQSFLVQLEKLRTELQRCWQAGTVSPQQIASIESAEAVLERLFEEARLDTSTHSPMSKYPQLNSGTSPSGSQH
jgi:hypothetical protein